jgi:terminase small subunit / prophage DNA-packing protein
MKDEIASAALQRILGINKSVLGELAQKGIIVRGEKRGSYALQASVSCYCQHLREQAAGRGGEAGADVRARLGAAQADLAAEKVKAMRGETLPTAEVEALWTSKLRTFRNRILAIPHKVKDLSARQMENLMQELRACLEELADDPA